MDMPSFHKFATRLSREETAAAASEYAGDRRRVCGGGDCSRRRALDLGKVFVVI
ncbi:MAG: hypothetical protein R3E45_07165 [Rhodocyclaceae bacterium]